MRVSTASGQLSTNDRAPLRIAKRFAPALTNLSYPCTPLTRLARPNVFVTACGLQKSLPTAPNGSQPLPEGMLWLLLAGTLPTQAQAQGLSENLRRRSKLPEHVYGMLNSLPKNTHPMTQLSMAVMALQPDSKFAQAYADGAASCIPFAHVSVNMCASRQCLPCA